MFSKAILCQSTAPSNHKRDCALCHTSVLLGRALNTRLCNTGGSRHCPGILDGLDNTASLGRDLLEP